MSFSFANKQLTCYWHLDLSPDLNDRLKSDDGIHSSAKVVSSCTMQNLVVWYLIGKISVEADRENNSLHGNSDNGAITPLKFY